MAGRFNRDSSSIRREPVSTGGYDLDADRTAFAVGLLGHCTLDLNPEQRASFWRAYAEARSADATGSSRMLDDLSGHVEPLAPLLNERADGLSEEGPLLVLRRRYDERVELGLELDGSEETRVRLARQMAAELELTPAEEIAVALALAGSDRVPTDVELEDAALAPVSLDEELAYLAKPPAKERHTI